MKALVGAFNQEKALVGAFSVIVQPVVEPMDRFTALITSIVPSQIDLLHIHANTTEEGSSDHVEVGIDLTEYYINVEWDILRWAQDNTHPGPGA